MHHASRDRASGFCIYNDAALAIQKLLDGGVQRVAYIDVDAHHGDGTQSIFWDDPRVLTISLHETGLTLFPGTGFANEIGGPNAQGSAVNVALPSGTGDAGWLRAFHAVVPQLIGAFEPEVIVSQHGCDSHRLDPLTHLNISVDGQREAATAVGNLAARYCGNRWIATGGGGYNVISVVPRSWSHLIAVAAGRPVPLSTRVPEDWRQYVQDKYGAKYGVSAPELMGDDVDLWWRSWEVGFDPNDEVDRTVMATRKERVPALRPGPLVRLACSAVPAQGLRRLGDRLFRLEHHSGGADEPAQQGQREGADQVRGRGSLDQPEQQDQQPHRQVDHYRRHDPRGQPGRDFGRVEGDAGVASPGWRSRRTSSSRRTSAMVNPRADAVSELSDVASTPAAVTRAPFSGGATVLPSGTQNPTRSSTEVQTATNRPRNTKAMMLNSCWRRKSMATHPSCLCGRSRTARGNRESVLAPWPVRGNGPCAGRNSGCHPAYMSLGWITW